MVNKLYHMWSSTRLTNCFICDPIQVNEADVIHWAKWDIADNIFYIISQRIIFDTKVTLIMLFPLKNYFPFQSYEKIKIAFMPYQEFWGLGCKSVNDSFCENGNWTSHKFHISINQCALLWLFCEVR